MKKNWIPIAGLLFGVFLLSDAGYRSLKLYQHQGAVALVRKQIAEDDRNMDSRTADILNIRQSLNPFLKLKSAISIGVTQYQLRSYMVDAQIELENLRHKPMLTLEAAKLRGDLLSNLGNSLQYLQEACDLWVLKSQNPSGYDLGMAEGRDLLKSAFDGKINRKLRDAADEIELAELKIPIR